MFYTQLIAAKPQRIYNHENTKITKLFRYNKHLRVLRGFVVQKFYSLRR
jgi:hypothetical protein